MPRAVGAEMCLLFVIIESPKGFSITGLEHCVLHLPQGKLLYQNLICLERETQLQAPLASLLSHLSGVSRAQKHS